MTPLDLFLWLLAVAVGLVLLAGAVAVGLVLVRAALSTDRAAKHREPEAVQEPSA